MAIEIVDLPIKNVDFPVRYVSLLEGNDIWNVGVTGKTWIVSVSIQNGDHLII
jgi:hypothetical protein